MSGPARNAPARIEVVAGVLRDETGRVLLAQRLPGKHLAGQWEFPGGKRESHESPAQALARELDEELGIEVREARPWLSLTHHYSELSVRLRFYAVDDWRGEPSGREGQPLHWASPDDLSSLPMPAADRPVVKALDLDGRYLRLPRAVDRNAWVRKVDAALDDGVRLFALRADAGTADELKELADLLGRRVRAAGGRWLLDGEPDRARQLAADGVAIAADRLNALVTRPLPDDALVAATCRTGADLDRAGALGLDFAVLSTQSGSSDALAPDALERLCADSPLPVFAAGSMDTSLSAVRDKGGFGVAWTADIGSLS
jgi:8-oxo-dGTP diphosphatase